MATQKIDLQFDLRDEPEPDYTAWIQKYSKQYNVDADLISRMMRQESKGNPNAVSPKAGAIGLMQLMPDTAEELGVDPHDPEQNVEGGIRYMRWLLDYYKDDRVRALAAYNAGMGRVDKAGGIPNIKETQDYVAKVNFDLQDEPENQFDLRDEPQAPPKPSGSVRMPVNRGEGAPMETRAPETPAPAKPKATFPIMAMVPGVGVLKDTAEMEGTTAKDILGQAWRSANRPLVPVTKLTEPLVEGAKKVADFPVKVPVPGVGTLDTTSSTAAGALHGLAGAAEGLTSPAGIAMMEGFGILTAPGRTLAKYAVNELAAKELAAKLGHQEFLGFLNSVLLSGYTVKQGYEGYKRAVEAELQGDDIEAVAGKTQAVADALMAAMFLYHAGKAAHEYARRDPYVYAVRDLKTGLQEKTLDAESLDNIRNIVQQRADRIDPQDLRQLNRLIRRAEERVRAQGPVPARPPAGAPAPPVEPPPANALATGPFPGPSPTVREQVGAPQQSALGAPPEGAPPAADFNLPPSQAGKPVGPRPQYPNLPGVEPQKPQTATIDWSGPMTDMQRRTIFAIANGRSIPKEVVEILAGKRISELNAGEARALMTRLNKITPAEVQSIKPIAETPLLDKGAEANRITQLEQDLAKLKDQFGKQTAPPPAPAAPPAAPPEQPATTTITIRPRKPQKFEPGKSLVNAIRHLGGIDPEKIRGAGIWTDWKERVPQGIRLAVEKKGAQHGLDTLGGELEKLGYPGYDLPDAVMEALADPKKARSGLKEAAEAKELDQAKAYIEQLQREMAELQDQMRGAMGGDEDASFNPEDFGPPSGGRQPGDEGFARFLDYRKPGYDKSKSAEYERLFRLWTKKVVERETIGNELDQGRMDPREGAFKLNGVLREMKALRQEMDTLREPGTVSQFKARAEEGFARVSQFPESREERAKLLWAGIRDLQGKAMKMQPGPQRQQLLEKLFTLKNQVDDLARGPKIEGAIDVSGKLTPEEYGRQLDKLKADEDRILARYKNQTTESNGIINLGAIDPYDAKHLRDIADMAEIIRAKQNVAQRQTPGPAKVYRFMSGGEEGFARIRDDRTGDLFGKKEEEEFKLTGGPVRPAAPEVKAPAGAAPTERPQQGSLLGAGPLFEKPEVAPPVAPVAPERAPERAPVAPAAPPSEAKPLPAVEPEKPAPAAPPKRRTRDPYDIEKDLEAAQRNHDKLMDRIQQSEDRIRGNRFAARPEDTVMNDVYRQAEEERVHRMRSALTQSSNRIHELKTHLKEAQEYQAWKKAQETPEVLEARNQKMKNYWAKRKEQERLAGEQPTQPSVKDQLNQMRVTRSEMRQDAIDFEAQQRREPSPTMQEKFANAEQSLHQGVVDAQKHTVSAVLDRNGFGEGSSPDEFILVSCSQTKAKAEAPAKDLYQGDLFKKQRAVAEQSGKPWMIMSAEHGLVDPEARLRPYDKTLVDMKPEERAKWGQQMADALAARLGPDTKITIYGGAAYRNTLTPELAKRGLKNIAAPTEGMGIGRQKQALKAQVESGPEKAGKRWEKAKSKLTPEELAEQEKRTQEQIAHREEVWKNTVWEEEPKTVKEVNGPQFVQAKKAMNPMALTDHKKPTAKVAIVIDGVPYVAVGGVYQGPGGELTLVRAYTPQQWGDRPAWWPKERPETRRGYEGAKVNIGGKEMILGSQTEGITIIPKGQGRISYAAKKKGGPEQGPEWKRARKILADIQSIRDGRRSFDREMLAKYGDEWEHQIMVPESRKAWEKYTPEEKATYQKLDAKEEQLRDEYEALEKRLLGIEEKPESRGLFDQAEAAPKPEAPKLSKHGVPEADLAERARELDEMAKAEAAAPQPEERVRITGISDRQQEILDQAYAAAKAKGNKQTLHQFYSRWKKPEGWLEEKPSEPVRPVEEAAGQFAQSEVDRRAANAAAYVDKIINSNTTWSQKRQALGLENMGINARGRFPDIPISKPERQRLIDKMMRETEEQTGLFATGDARNFGQPEKPKGPQKGLFGDEEGWARIEVDDDRIKKLGLKDFMLGSPISPERIAQMEALNKELMAIEDLRDRGGRISHDLAARRIDEAHQRAGIAPYELRDYNLDKLFSREATTRPRFDSPSLQVPGGSNYRELFVTAPRSPEAERWGQLAERMQGGLRMTPEEMAEMRDIQRRYERDERIGWRDGHEAYSDIENPVVRLRFNERFVPDPNGPSLEYPKEGKIEGGTWKNVSEPRKGFKVLFIEEMQPPSKPQMAKMPSALKNKWREIGLERALRYALDNGYDRVAWTTGQMQLDRYPGIQKVADSIEVFGRTDAATGEETRALTIHMKDGRPVDLGVNAQGIIDNATHDTRVDFIGKPLDAVVGKELAQKIMSGPRTAQYRDTDLKIGGEGLSKVYDTDLPNVAKRFGAKVEKSTIDVPGEPGRSAEGLLNEYLDLNLDPEHGYSFVVNKAGEEAMGWDKGEPIGGVHRNERDARVEALDLLRDWVKPPQSDKITVPSVDLAELKARAGSRGEEGFARVREDEKSDTLKGAVPVSRKLGEIYESAGRGTQGQGERGANAPGGRGRAGSIAESQHAEETLRFNPRSQTIVTWEAADKWLADRNLKPEGKYQPKEAIRAMQQHPDWDKLSIDDRARLQSQLERVPREKTYADMPMAKGTQERLQNQQNRKALGLLGEQQTAKVKGSGTITEDTIVGCYQGCTSCYGLAMSQQAAVRFDQPVRKPLAPGPLHADQLLRIGTRGDPSIDWQWSNEQVAKKLEESRAKGHKVSAEKNVTAFTNLHNLDGYDPKVFPNLEVTLDPQQMAHMTQAMVNILRVKAEHPEVNIAVRIRTLASKSGDMMARQRYAQEFADRFSIPRIETKMRFLGKGAFETFYLDENAYTTPTGRGGGGSPQYQMKEAQLEKKGRRTAVCDELGGSCPACGACKRLMIDQRARNIGEFSAAMKREGITTSSFKGQPRKLDVLGEAPVQVQGPVKFKLGGEEGFATFTSEEIDRANKSARWSGAVGLNALTPRKVMETAGEGESILDFGAGPPAIHTDMMRKAGLDATAHEFGKNFVRGVHDPEALKRTYDTVMGSNVLNVQTSEDMLRRTLSEMRESIREKGRAVFNYPQSPRYANLPPERVEEIIREFFPGVKLVGGTKAAPIWEARTTAGPQGSLFGGDEGFARFRESPFKDDPEMERILARLRQAEKTNGKSGMIPPMMPEPGDADVPGAMGTLIGKIRSADILLARNDVTRPVAEAIRGAERAKKQAMQHYYDLGVEIMQGVKRKSEEAYAVFDLLDGKMRMQEVRSEFPEAKAEQIITAATRLRNEIFEPIIRELRSPDLVKEIGKTGYIRSYAPHFIEQLRRVGIESPEKIFWDLLPKTFKTRFAKPRDWKMLDYSRDIFEALPVYINGTMKTLHDIPGYSRAIKALEGVPQGPFRDLAEWYADNYIGQPKMKAGKVEDGISNLVSHRISQLYYDAYVGLNPASAALNLTQTLTNTFPELGAKYVRMGVQDLLLNKQLREQFHKSGILFDYPGLEEELSPHGRIRKGLQYMFQKAEYFNRGVAYLGALRKAKSMGLVGQAAEKFAFEMVEKTQFTYSKGSAVYALEKTPAMLRTFQTFALKEQEFVTNMITDAIKGGAAERAKLARFLMVVAAIPLVGHAVGVSPKSIDRYSLGLSNLIPGGSPATKDFLALSKYLWEIEAGKHKPEDIPVDLLKKLATLIPGARAATNAATDLGIVPEKKQKSQK